MHSKVFEKMLNSEMKESTSNDTTFDDSMSQASIQHFEQMIHFIHMGHLGVPIIQMDTKDREDFEPHSLIKINDLISLIQIADEYQVESLTRAISHVLNDYNASTTAIRSGMFLE